MTRDKEMTNVSFNYTHLTLIGPGEIKVDLADFDLKLQENWFSTLYIFFYLFLQKRLPDLFKLLT
jgi:hypothetical protein